MQEKRIALLGIIVENKSATAEINQLLHECGEYIIGRLGLPYRERNISIISVVLDAPQDAVSTLSGKLGMLPGVSVKTIFSKQSFTTGNNTDGE
ncbi:MAG: iron-only hydrogenase system regulator [Lentisphaeria bacterium]|nr:iron-only hydrogenase system regulator [Lentisphaeria bacterium]